MSKVKIEGNASGTGTFTLAAPNSNTDRTLTLPDADITLGGGVDGVDSDYTSGTAVKIDSSGNVGVGSTSPQGKLDVRGDGALDIANNSIGAGAYGTVSIISDNGGNNGADATPMLMFKAPYAASLADRVGYGAIQGGKQNSSQGNRAGYLKFLTHNQSSLVETMRIDSSGNLKFNSGYGSAATAYGCRAWVNFNGTGTVAIRASGNVSSITDNGTGLYTVNFTTAMTDANYAFSGAAWRSTTGASAPYVTTPNGSTDPATTTALSIMTSLDNANEFDMATVAVAIFR